MTTSVNNALIRFLEQDISARGFNVSFVPASTEIPYDVVLVVLETLEEESFGWQLELSLLPIAEEDMEETALLQCFVPLSVKVSPEAEQALMRIIVMLNSRLPVGGFGYLESDKMIFFRNVLMLMKHDLSASAALVNESIFMVGYLLNTFAETVASVASGQASVEEAVSRSQFGNLFMI